MASYGIPYQGSKSKIAKEIVEILPVGYRLADLFGGGCAITHCAALSGKWRGILYNDINPVLTSFIAECIEGKYLPHNYTPVWASRDDFFSRKEVDGYIKFIFSFGGNGQDYMYSPDKEPCKKILHEAIVLGEVEKLNLSFPHFNFTKSSIKDRRLELGRYIKHNLRHSAWLGDARAEHLERWQRLWGLAELKNIELTTKGYEDYVYREGDVVYCDIPYENTGGYDYEFNHAEFFEWCETQPFDIYVSSYKIDRPAFTEVWCKNVKSTLARISNSTPKVERLYLCKGKSEERR